MWTNSTVTERPTPENRVTIHIWRASEVWSGVFKHLTGREVYRIGHVALQTYNRPDPRNPGQELEGKFINFFPPQELTEILTISVGKTPGQKLSYNYRHNAAMFFALEQPSISIDLYSLNIPLIEMMHEEFLKAESEGKVIWSAFNFSFFSRNKVMSSTKLALSLLQLGAGGQLDNAPISLSIPVLHELGVIRNSLVQLALVDGIRLDSNTTLQDIANIFASHAKEVNDFVFSIISTLTSVVSTSTTEIEQIVNYLQQQEAVLYGENTNTIDNGLSVTPTVNNV